MKAGHRELGIGLAIVAAVLLLLGAAITKDAVRVRLVRARAASVRPGDSKARVQGILGEPDASFAKGSGLLDGMILGLFPQSPEQWAYGRRFHWKTGLLIPFQSRAFGPDPDDVVVSFDDRGKVKSVTVP